MYKFIFTFLANLNSSQSLRSANFSFRCSKCVIVEARSQCVVCSPRRCCNISSGMVLKRWWNTDGR